MRLDSFLSKAFSLLKISLLLSLVFVGCKNDGKALLTEKDEEVSTSEMTEDAETQERELPESNIVYVVVNSPEDINVRSNPDLLSTKVAGLTDKSVVKLLQEGDEVTIDEITAPWLEIELPAEIAQKENVKTGWVFGGYMTRNALDVVPDEYFEGNPFSSKRVGLSAVGSYVKPNKTFSMHSSPSRQSRVVSSFKENDLGIIIRALEDSTGSETFWYYILNQVNGKKGWIESKSMPKATADGYKISDTKRFYIRKNADVLVEKLEYEIKSRYLSNLVLCSDNIHYVARVNDGRALAIYNRNNDEVKLVELDVTVARYGYTSKSASICYSAKSNCIYFGWGASLYTYSLADDQIELVYKIDTTAPEALSSSLAIKAINVSKDENYIYLVAEFYTGSRYVSRMVAYNAVTKTQKILDTPTPKCDSDHYYGYSRVDFDENNNAIYSIYYTRYESVYEAYIDENAYVTVPSDDFSNPVLHILPKEHYAYDSVYLPSSNDVLCCNGRFRIYELDSEEVHLKSSYRFAESSILDSIPDYGNYQFNSDKSICAVNQDGYIAFYSTKTFNLLFALPCNAYRFWWNGEMLLAMREYDDDYIFSSYNISITEKENQISDNEPLTKAQVGLCAKVFRCETEGDDMGYKFTFSPNGYYLCYSYFAMAEAEEMEKGIIGAYEITEDGLVHLYPYFAEVDPYWYREDNDHDFSEFKRFNLYLEQEGIYLYMSQGGTSYNRFGNMYLYDDESNKRICSTYDWFSTCNYGVNFEEAASAYEISK